MKTTPFLDAIESISKQADKDMQRQIAMHNHLAKRLKEEFGYEYISGIRYAQNVQVFLEIERNNFNK